MWDPLKFSSHEEIAVSEVWQDEDKLAIETKHQTIHNDKVSAWLDQGDRARGIASRVESHRCVLRVVWINYAAKQSFNIRSDTFEQISRGFHQETAQRCVRSSYACISCLPETTTRPRVYMFGNHPNFTVTWSKEPSSEIINVICIAVRSKIEVLQDLLESNFIQRLAHLELAPALMNAIMHSKEVDERLEDVKVLVREVESRTGHHDFETRSELPARGDLFSLAAKMSGCGTKIASHLRKLGILEELNRFILEDVRQVCQDSSSLQAGSGLQELLSDIKIIEQRAVLQRNDVEYIRCRVQTQRDALFHLIAENDAALSHDMATDSRTLALASQRDSASMKSLAVVSMFFLPGTFVASLFGMPLFDWGSDVSNNQAENIAIWGPRLGLFLAVTLPLMLLTFLTWVLWMWRQREERNHQFTTTHVQLDSGVLPSEVRALALKQMSSLASDSGM